MHAFSIVISNEPHLLRSHLVEVFTPLQQDFIFEVATSLGLEKEANWWIGLTDFGFISRWYWIKSLSG